MKIIISLLLIIFCLSCQNKSNIVQSKNEIIKETKNITSYGFGSGNNQAFADNEANIDAITTIIAQAYGINFEYNLQNNELKEINKNIMIKNTIIKKENFIISNRYYSLITTKTFIETEKPKNIKPLVYTLETNINFNEYYKFINNYRLELISSIIKEKFPNQKNGIIQGKLYINDMLLEKNENNLFVKIKFEIYFNIN